jgi:hypothetical protein
VCVFLFFIFICNIYLFLQEFFLPGEREEVKKGEEGASRICLIIRAPTFSSYFQSLSLFLPPLFSFSLFEVGIYVCVCVRARLFCCWLFYFSLSLLLDICNDTFTCISLSSHLACPPLRKYGRQTDRQTHTQAHTGTMQDRNRNALPSFRWESDRLFIYVFIY